MQGQTREDINVGTVSLGGSESNENPNGQARDLRLKPSVSVMIPTLNEARNLPYVLNTVPGWVDEIIIVDGRSTDDTLRIAKVLRPDIRVIYEPKPGKGAAMKTGFEAASGDFIIALDADGSMDGAEIGAFRDALEAGADYVKGTRFGPGGGSADITRFRRFGDGGICLLIRLLFGGRYTDATYGYIGVRAESVDKIGIDSDGFEVETLIGIRAHRAGLKTTEVPCFETSRIHGTSNLHALRDGIRIFTVIVKERFRRNRHRAAKTGLGNERSKFNS
jgi:glycosyltransferase involved in cell wall biosynthesis